MLRRLMLLDDVPVAFVKVFAVLFGLAWGSFATVAIGRIPQGLSVVTPGSRCDGCGSPIDPAKNVPVLAWLFLRGRASCCGARIPVRVPIVEALGGALAYLACDRALVGGVTVGALALALVVFAASLTAVVLTFIDLDYLYLPDGGVVLLAALGAAHTLLRHGAWSEGAIGAVVGFAVVYVPFIWLYERLRGFPGMGLGDAKLLAAVGLWFGGLGAVAVLVLAAIQGTLVALATLLVRGRIEEPEAVVREREELHALAAQGDAEAAKILAEDPLAEAPPEGLAGARLAFGPFLCVAFLEWLFLEDALVAQLLPGL
jgi:leader peptidase (prepilin peptidase) / N-methyltransferase